MAQKSDESEKKCLTTYGQKMQEAPFLRNCVSLNQSPFCNPIYYPLVWGSCYKRHFWMIKVAERKKKIWKKCCNACESAWSKHGKVIPEQSIGFHFNWTFDLILVILTFFVHGIWFLHFDMKKRLQKGTNWILDFFVLMW